MMENNSRDPNIDAQREAIENEMEWDTNLEAFGGVDAVRDWVNRLAMITRRGGKASVKDKLSQTLAAAMYRAQTLEEDLHEPPFDWNATPTNVVQKLDALIKAAQKK